MFKKLFARDVTCFYKCGSSNVENSMYFRAIIVSKKEKRVANQFICFDRYRLYVERALEV